MRAFGLSLLVVVLLVSSVAAKHDVNCSDLDHKKCRSTNGCVTCRENKGKHFCLSGSQADIVAGGPVKCDDERSKTEPEPEPSTCKDHDSKDGCLDDEACSWCKMGKVAKSCVDKEAASFLQPLFKCKDAKAHKHHDKKHHDKKHHDKKSRKEVDDKLQELETDEVDPSTAACLAYLKKKDCKNNGNCAWCTYTIGGIGNCIGQDQAQLIPESVAKCTSGEQPIDDDEDEEEAEEAVLTGFAGDADVGADGSGCKHAKKHDCRHSDECAWCTFMGVKETCMKKDAVQFIPSFVVECKATKHHKRRVNETEGVEEEVQEEDEEEEVVMTASGDDPAGAGASGCKHASKHECRHDDACAWCSFMGSKGHCMPQMAVEFIPPGIAECKEAKHHKKRADGVEVEDDDDEDDEDDVVLTASAGDALTPGGSGCSSHMDKHACKDDGKCSWCKMGGLGSCLDQDYTKYIPSGLIECSGSKKHKKNDGALEGADEAQLLTASGSGVPGGAAASGCSSHMKRDDCKDDDKCSWCTYMGFGSGTCMDKDYSKFIPSSFMKCKEGKHHGKHHKENEVEGEVEDEQNEEVVLTASGGDAPAAGGSGCKHATKHDCRHDDACTWCTFMGSKGHCLSKAATEFIPIAIAECKAPKHHKQRVNETAVDVTEEVEDNEDEDVVLNASGGGVPGGAGAPGCSSHMKKGDCKDDGKCSWCTYMGFGSGTCMDKDNTKFIPSSFMKCKEGKHHKKNEVEGEGEDEENEEEAAEDVVLSAFAGGADAGADGSGCKHAKKHDCRNADECAWCTFMGVKETCMKKDAVQFIPSFVVECKATKHHKRRVNETEGVEEEVQEEDEEEEVVLTASGDDAAAAGASGCKHVAKHDCRHDDACAWCSFMGSKGHCMTKMAVEFIPPGIAECKEAKHHKKRADGVEVEDDVDESTLKEQ